MQNNRAYLNDLETIIIFGTFQRFEIAKRSLSSLIKATNDSNSRIIVSCSSSFSHEELNWFSEQDVDFIWTPGDVSMATSRNVSLKYAQDKYCFSWILFLEDDIIYKDNWYSMLINFANNSIGKIGPHGLIYRVFTASPGLISKNKNCIYDSDNDCYSLIFGARADQRLYDSSFFFNVVKEWDADILGISSAQTGKQNNRATMRGYCAASIGHLGFCTFDDEDESTWVGLRDIGPAAFDKRIEGYASIIQRVSEKTYELNGEIRKNNEMKKVSKIKPKTRVPMTAVSYSILDRIKAKIRKLLEWMKII
jgi:hypothetical protein